VKEEKLRTTPMVGVLVFQQRKYIYIIMIGGVGRLEKVSLQRKTR